MGPHMGPILGAHVGPIITDAIWAPYGDRVSPTWGPICAPHDPIMGPYMEPIWCPYGAPYGAHMGPCTGHIEGPEIGAQGPPQLRPRWSSPFSGRLPAPDPRETRSNSLSSSRDSLSLPRLPLLHRSLCSSRRRGTSSRARSRPTDAARWGGHYTYPIGTGRY